MEGKLRSYDAPFREGAVRIVRETGKSAAEVARDLGVHEGTLRTWSLFNVATDRVTRSSPVTGEALEAPRSSRTAVPIGSKSRTAERARGTEA
ncbi:transposase [Streptomyces sp. NPDC059680]|uniref:transposase n=1 Tax=Streptomyces sp. NPDC059680 TaxID=3346904 RepID=UPI0036AC7645